MRRLAPGSPALRARKLAEEEDERFADKVAVDNEQNEHANKHGDSCQRRKIFGERVQAGQCKRHGGELCETSIKRGVDVSMCRWHAS